MNPCMPISVDVAFEKQKKKPRKTKATKNTHLAFYIF